MNETCKTCPAWTQDQTKSQLLWDGSTTLRMQDGWGVCMMATAYGEERGDEESLAVAVDAESYCAELFTHETFGCNQRPSEWPREE